MTEPYERLQQARKKAGFETASDAARAFGWNENTYRSHENGERGLKPATAARYAKCFKTSYGWLLTGEGVSKDRRSIPLRGWIKAKGKVDFIKETDVDRTINTSFDLPEDAYCLKIVTDSMYPRYVDGDVLIFWGNDNHLDYSKHAEGIAWVGDGKCHFGVVTEEDGLSTIEVIGAKPRRNIKVTRLAAAEAVIRETFYSETILPPIENDLKLTPSA